MSNRISVNYSELYLLSDPLIKWPFRLTTLGQDWINGERVWALFQGESQPPEPLILKAEEGKLATDFLWTYYPPLVSISQRVLDLLKNNNFNGWSTYPVVVYDRKGLVLEGYNGFAVKSYVGNEDINRSRIIDAPPLVPKSKPRKVYKGMFFDESKWDGSDFFRINEGFKVITKRVYEVFKIAKIKNVHFEPLSQVQIDTFVYEGRGIKRNSPSE